MLNYRHYQLITIQPDDGIYKYDHVRNKWSKMIDLHIQLPNKTAMFEYSTNCIYTCNGYYIFKFDLNTKQMSYTQLSKQVQYPILVSKTITTNVSQIDVLEGTNHHRCSYFMTNQQKYITTTSIEHDISMQHGMYITNVETYSLQQNQWTTWNIKSLPHNSQIIATQNEDYLIFIGGINAYTKTRHPFKTKQQQLSNHIYVFDVKHHKLLTSSIKTPCLEFRAQITGDILMDQLLVYSYCNTSWMLKQFHKVSNLSLPLIQLIANYMRIERIHLIGNKSHWSINIDNIIQSTNIHNFLDSNLSLKLKKSYF